MAGLNDSLNMAITVDWDVKPQTKFKKKRFCDNFCQEENGLLVWP